MTLLANMKGEIIDRENLFIYAPQCSFMKVGIGTQNPLKAKVVRDIFGKVFEDVEVSSIEVESGVSEQPKKKQVLEGALNRAKKSLKDNDFGVGIEAGTTEIDGRVFVIGYCVVIDKNGNYTIGSQPMFELPNVLAKRIRAGETLGNVADEYFNTKDIKKSTGAVGILSNYMVTREDLMRSALLTALIPLISKNVYSE